MDTDIFKSLTDIVTKYSVFEPDQVLTHDELNSIAGCLDDQTRLTRVNLLGVGVVGGLRVSLQTGATTTLRRTKGMGITTDGDLIYCPDDMTFDRYKLYDKSKPKYKPFFYVNDDMITMYELVAQGTPDEPAKALSQFNNATGKNLQRDMVAVLLMESYIEDPDLCTGTGCDNLGKHCHNNLKLLMVEKAFLKPPLKPVISTPHQAYGVLKQVQVPRPVITAAIKSAQELDQAYLDACKTLREALSTELGKLYHECASFIEVFPSDPFPDWSNKLGAVPASGRQYYYDFLKDVAETYNQFRRLLCGVNVWLCPNLNAFPKHLLLGNLVPSGGPDENRLGFYPSPLMSRNSEQLDHARFLAGKIDRLIQNFQFPQAAAKEIRITPSLSEEHPLEERAIPFYYQIDPNNPIYRSWNYRLHQEGMDDHIYSYWARREYAGQGGAQDPLNHRISHYPFFRIEGHLNQDVKKAHEDIQKKISDNNLHFAVRSVLAPGGTKPLRPFPPLYTDLHRLHFMLRQDLSQQLDDVIQFGDNFQDRVEKSTVAKAEPKPDDLIAVARTANATVKDNARKTMAKLNLNYANYSKPENAAWKETMTATMEHAGNFKHSLGDVIRTEFTTPLDSLISSTHGRWLDWLDEIIDRRDSKKDDKLLFTNFLTQHPGLEHLGGVRPGGTFVLVYDPNGMVVADFALPYFSPEPAAEEFNEDALAKPTPRPLSIVDNAIRIQPSREQFMGGKINTAVEAVHKGYAEVFKESFTTMSTVITGKIKEPVTPGPVRDTKLNDKFVVVKEAQSTLEFARKKLQDPRLPEDQKRLYTVVEGEAEKSLIAGIDDTTNYVETARVDVSENRENQAIIKSLANSALVIKDTNPDKTRVTEKIKKFGPINR